MNRKQFFRRMMVALVILLGVQVSASAQFGGLKKAADKAMKTATEKVKKAKDAVTGTTSQSNSSYQEYEDGGYSNDGGMTVMGGSGSRDAEFNRVKKAALHPCMLFVGTNAQGVAGVHRLMLLPYLPIEVLMGNQPAAVQLKLTFVPAALDRHEIVYLTLHFVDDGGKLIDYCVQSLLVHCSYVYSEY